MHAAMQPPEKGGTELPPRRVRPHHWWAPWPPSLGRDPSRGYGWIQFGVLVGFSIYLLFGPFLNMLS